MHVAELIDAFVDKVNTSSREPQALEDIPDALLRFMKGAPFRD
jgi:hypothetical protein